MYKHENLYHPSLSSAGNLADEDYAYVQGADVNGDGFITEDEMKAGLEFGRRTCRIVHQIHKDLASDKGCLGKDGVDEDKFRRCLEKLAE
jgi:hypothetical protein